MRRCRIGTKALDFVLLVGLEVSFEPVPVGGVFLSSLVRKDVGRDSVEEPPIVGDYDGTTGEFE